MKKRKRSTPKKQHNFATNEWDLKKALLESPLSFGSVFVTWIETVKVLRWVLGGGGLTALWLLWSSMHG